jgi:hypothetical protein
MFRSNMQLTYLGHGRVEVASGEYYMFPQTLADTP